MISPFLLSVLAMDRIRARQSVPIASKPAEIPEQKPPAYVSHQQRRAAERQEVKRNDMRRMPGKARR